jgi:hypothetical protein
VSIFDFHWIAMAVNSFALNSFLSYRLSFKLEPDSAMNEPIENGLKCNGIFNDLFPVLEGNLTRDDGAPGREAFLKNVKEILHNSCRKFFDAKVIENQAISFYETITQSKVAPFGSRKLKLFNQFMNANKDCGSTRN